MKIHFHIKILLSLAVIISGIQITYANSINPQNDNRQVIITSDDQTINLNEDEKLIIRSVEMISFKPGTKINAGTQLSASIITTPADDNESNSSIELIEILKRHKESGQQSYKAEFNDKRSGFETYIYDERLSALVKAYEMLSQKPDEIQGFFHTNNKNKNTYITAYQSYGIASEQNKRLSLLRTQTSHFSSPKNPSKKDFCPITSGRRSDVMLVLRL